VTQIRSFSISVMFGVVALVLGNWAVNAQNYQRRVLFLYPYDDVHPSTIEAGAGMRKRLVEKSPSKLDIYTNFLDLARFPTEADELRSAHYLSDKFASKPLDIIMALNSEAEHFLLKYRNIIAPNVPIVFCCARPEVATAADRPANVTGVFSEFDANKTIALAQQLQPDARNLIIVSGSSEIDRGWLKSLRTGIEPYEHGFNTEYWVGLPYETLLERASHLSRDTIVIFVTVYGDGTGRPFVPALVVEALAAAASAPVYGPSDTYLGRGIVGGHMSSFEAMGAEAADMALDILDGKDPTTVAPKSSEDRKFQIDARQLERWKLSEKNLPKGTIVSFKQPTLWEEHRGLVLASIFVVLLQATLIMALFIQILRRRRAETASLMALADLARVARLTTIGEMTASIAHEINQPLGAIVTNGEAGLRWLGNATPDLGEVRAALTRIINSGHRASQVISRIRAMLKKDVDARVLLDFNDLVEEVLLFVRGEINDHNVVVRTQLRGDLPRIFADRIQLQQVVLNLVLNGIDALASTDDRERQLNIRSEQDDPRTVMLSVEDSGQGIDTDIKDRIFEAFFTTKSHGMGMGLSICRSIIASHGGRLLVSAGHPHGAVFQVKLPVHKSAVA
jgi:signal transduction histidine kinase